MHMGYLSPYSVQCHLGVIRCICLKMACASKRAGHRLNLEVVVDIKFTQYVYWVPIELLVFKVIQLLVFFIINK